ncbi:MAG TPA: hypothetical protein EYN22_00250, partial [Nitrospinaceae bacterium]|nr:hypothetical protein [Nitrospinaceae bacterium]
MSEIRIRSKKDFKSLDTKEMAKLAQYFGIPHSGNTKKKEFKRKIWAEIKEQSKERGDFIVGFSSDSEKLTKRWEQSETWKKESEGRYKKQPKSEELTSEQIAAKNKARAKRARSMSTPGMWKIATGSRKHHPAYKAAQKEIAQKRKQYDEWLRTHPEMKKKRSSLSPEQIDAKDKASKPWDDARDKHYMIVSGTTNSSYADVDKYLARPKAPTFEEQVDRQFGTKQKGSRVLAEERAAHEDNASKHIPSYRGQSQAAAKAHQGGHSLRQSKEQGLVGVSHTRPKGSVSEAMNNRHGQKRSRDSSAPHVADSSSIDQLEQKKIAQENRDYERQKEKLAQEIVSPNREAAQMR